jgi:hypothetical protein
MFTEILFFALVTSGISLSWHVFLEDHPPIKTRLKSLSKVFVCGICQTFWLTLLFTIFGNPSFSITWRFLPELLEPALTFIAFWQATAFTGYAFRYGGLLILESAKARYKQNNT